MSSEQRATAAETIALAEDVLAILEQRGHRALVVGGFALAVHNYPRATEDLDLGFIANPADLAPLRNALVAGGFAAELRMPDADDPLGGVIDVRNERGALVQVINFYNEPGGGFPKPIRDALRAAQPLSLGSTLCVVPLPQLIALKIYAGDLQDVRALLANNTDADVAGIKALCESYDLPTDVLNV